MKVSDRSTTSFTTVPPERRVRTVLVGAGGMGVVWAQRLVARPEVELVGWVDLDAARLAAGADTLDAPEIELATSLGAAAAVAVPDLVVDVTVPASHRSVTEEALELGAAVLGEKPMAATMADARAMVATAERTGGLYVVSQTRRHHRSLRSLKEEISALGRIGIIDAGFYLAPRFGGFRDAMEHPLLLDMSIHAMDTARFLHASPPVAVMCDAYNPPWSWYAGSAAATAVFELADGARFTYQGCWCAEGSDASVTSWNAQWRVVGEHGTALWDGESAAQLCSTAGQRSVGSRGPAAAESVDGVLAEMLVALRTGVIPPNECHENLLTLAMVHAAVRSSDERRRVEIAEVLAG